MEREEDKPKYSLGAKMNFDSEKYKGKEEQKKDAKTNESGWTEEWNAMSAQMGETKNFTGKDREFGRKFLSNRYAKENKFQVALEESLPRHQISLQSLGIPVDDKRLDSATCIWAYTKPSPAIFDHLNDVLYAQDKEKIVAWDSYVYSLCRGLEALPLFWGTVYRVVSGAWATEANWKVGEIVHWFPFTSSSVDKFMALGFSCGCRHIFFEITSWTGRDISTFSAIPEEKEVLFRCVTDFFVKEVSPWNGNQRKVVLEEVTNIKPGFDKILLWVDDNPENNNKMLAQCEALEINIIIRKTTESALLFIKSCPEYYARIKIVSDMGRVEENKFIQNAGAVFLEELVKYTGLDWKDKFIFYVGDVFKANGFLPSRLRYIRVFNDDMDVKQFLGFEK